MADLLTAYAKLIELAPNNYDLNELFGAPLDVDFDELFGSPVEYDLDELFEPQTPVF